jgi:hypothetical protein
VYCHRPLLLGISSLESLLNSGDQASNFRQQNSSFYG